MYDQKQFPVKSIYLFEASKKNRAPERSEAPASKE